MIYFFIPESVYKNYYFRIITRLFLFINCFLFLLCFYKEKKDSNKTTFIDPFFILFLTFTVEIYKKKTNTLLFCFVTYLVIIFILLFKINNFFLFKFIIKNLKTSFGHLLQILLYFFLFINPIRSFFFLYFHKDGKEIMEKNNKK